MQLEGGGHASRRTAVPALSPLRRVVCGSAGEGALQQPGEPPGWEVLLQENVQLREDLQQWKAKVGGWQPCAGVGGGLTVLGTSVAPLGHSHGRSVGR